MFRIKRSLENDKTFRRNLKYIVYFQLALGILITAGAIFFLWVDLPSLILIVVIVGFWFRLPLKIYQFLNNHFLYKNKSPEEIIKTCTSYHGKKSYFFIVVVIFIILVFYIQILLAASYIDYIEKFTQTSIDGIIIFSALMGLWAVVSFPMFESYLTITKYEKILEKENLTKEGKNA